MSVSDDVAPVTGPDDVAPDNDTVAGATRPDESPDLRIGAPEREIAREALHAHFYADRLDTVELEQRVDAIQSARTSSELLRIFTDLPAPHPELPGPPRPPEPDDDLSKLGGAVVVALLLGMPVAIVLGIAYGAWWALAVPVAVSVLLLVTDHLISKALAEQR